MSLGLELIGIVSCVLGWLLAIVACALPMWRVTAFIGSNIVTAQIIWDGLWMSCVVQSTGQMQCKVYDSMLALSQDLQAARALTVISILLTVLAVLVSIGGAKCTNCIEDESSKAKVMIFGGVIFIVAGLMQLIPVSWSANSIIRDFYNPLLPDAQRRELGAALYIGWAAAALLIMGGSLLCCSSESSSSEPISSSPDAATDIWSSAGAPKETTGAPRGRSARPSGSSTGTVEGGGARGAVRPVGFALTVTLRSPPRSSAKVAALCFAAGGPLDRGMHDGAPPLLRYWRRDRNTAMDIFPQWEHDSSTNAASACCAPRHERQRTCPSSGDRNRPHPETHGLNDILKKTQGQTVLLFCEWKLLF
ncbi:claudin-4 isoform X1 [Pseudorasbora parva]|uniref:claudin-4 isoform X1 n=1 Tax=Pseudorasbora parva TaxID=51549 RepID=UPI00351DB560